MSTCRTLLRGGQILSLDPDTPPAGDVLIEGDTIVAVGVDLPVSDADVIDVSGNIVMPGMIDTHRHAWQTQMRAICGDWTLTDYSYGIRLGISPAYTAEDVCLGNRLGALEALNAGVTTLLDFSHCINTPEHADAAVRNHCGRHFPVQSVAKATYREILERRAKANGVDFVEGVATAITPIAFFETIMVKSYETLVDSDTKVEVNTGMVAAGRLQSLIDSRDYDHELLAMKVQVAAICKAVKSTVPPEMWGDEKLDEAEQHQEALDVGEDSFYDAGDEPFDPTEFIDDEDDEF